MASKEIIDIVKSHIKMPEILKYYDVKMPGDTSRNFQYKCPLPTHGSSDRGASARCYANNSWACFTEGRGGDVIDFVLHMEGHASRAKAAYVLWSRFGKDWADAVFLETKINSVRNNIRAAYSDVNFAKYTDTLLKQVYDRVSKLDNEKTRASFMVDIDNDLDEFHVRPNLTREDWLNWAKTWVFALQQAAPSISQEDLEEMRLQALSSEE